MNRLLMEALSSSVSAQAVHTLPAFKGPVASLALHYGIATAGEAAYSKIKKHPKLKKKYDKTFRPRNPKARPGRFASDLTSVGGTAAGLKLASKLKGSAKQKMVAALLGGVGGHTAGRYAGNKLGMKINRKLYAKRRNK